MKSGWNTMATIEMALIFCLFQVIGEIVFEVIGLSPNFCMSLIYTILNFFLSFVYVTQKYKRKAKEEKI